MQPIVGALLTLFLLLFAAPGAVALQLNDGDRVVVMGNGFAEGMYRHGWLEAAVQAANVGKQISVRNLGWAGDTPALQPRELNFGTMTDHLLEQRADVIIAAWGMNESFAGEAGLVGFESDLRAWIDDMKRSRFNSKTAPRLVLLSPIAHENLGPPLPDGLEHNRDLARYTEAMRMIAGQTGVEFVDLYAPSLTYYRSGAERHLTSNGIHPTEYGYWYLTQFIVGQLQLAEAGGAMAAPESVQALRRAIWDKNWHFFLRWRPVNMEYIRGRRREPFGMENFPREFAALDEMIAARDAVIWERAKATVGAVWDWQPGARELWELAPAYQGIVGP